MRAPLPDLGGAEWVEDIAPDRDILDGRPILVHFWSVGCGICHDVAERVAGWRERYGAQGLAFVAVHQPRSPQELDAVRVAADARGAMQIEHPCAIDSAHAIVDRFDNRFVPAYYLFDGSHELRHFQAGDKGYDRIESAIERVLEEARLAQV
ncbi:MAG: TlpA disulfide reductase family protein [Candidatus Baltobacteraceae bacterium]